MIEPATLITDLIRGLADRAVEIVDLTQPLSESTPVIELPPPLANSPGLSRRELGRYDERNPVARWNVLEFGEHTGTHIDAPIHWITGRDGKDVASIEPERLVGPAVVIDKSAEAAKDPGYLLTVADLEAFEAEHGEIPPGAWVLFRTGWGKRAGNKESFLNHGPEGPVTPGPDVAASRWLAEARDISGFATETVGPDAGAAGELDPPWPAHYFILGAGRCTLSGLANLDKLPPTGALIVVAPLKLVEGTGSPARVLAFVPADSRPRPAGRASCMDDKNREEQPETPDGAEVPPDTSEHPSHEEQVGGKGAEDPEKMADEDRYRKGPGW